MKRGICRAIAAGISVFMLIGCGVTGQRPDTGGTVSAAAAEQEVKPALPFETSYEDLRFLNEEQQEAFTFVMEHYMYLGHANDCWQGAEGDLSETVEIDGYTYYLSGYGLHEWEDFYAYWTQGYAKDYFDALLEERMGFIAHDGKAWVLGGGSSGNALTPVGYEISEISDSSISFYIRSFGMEEYWEGDFTKQYFDRVTLTQTEEGWRCTDFPWR